MNKRKSKWYSLVHLIFDQARDLVEDQTEDLEIDKVERGIYLKVWAKVVPHVRNRTQDQIVWPTER